MGWRASSIHPSLSLQGRACPWHRNGEVMLAVEEEADILASPAPCCLEKDKPKADVSLNHFESLQTLQGFSANIHSFKPPPQSALCLCHEIWMSYTG